MKKKLLIASLMLTSPAAIISTSEIASAASETMQEIAQKVKLSFVADQLLTNPLYKYDEDGGAIYIGDEVLQVSINFVPIDTQKDEWLFEKENFKKLDKNDQEFEMFFQAKNVDTGKTYIASDSTFYAIKKADTFYVFDCDSSQSCDAGEKSKSFAVLKVKNNTLFFVHVEDYFFAPYGAWESNKFDKYISPVTQFKYQIQN